MASALPQFVVDAQGNRTAVLLDMQKYQELLEAQEELDAVQAFDVAMAADADEIPLEDAIREMEADRR